MDNFIPLNGAPELQEEAVKQIASLPESPLYELRFEWEKDVYLVIANDPFDSSLIKIGIVLNTSPRWNAVSAISREMLKDVALEVIKQIIQEEINCIKKSAE